MPVKLRYELTLTLGHPAVKWGSLDTLVTVWLQYAYVCQLQVVRLAGNDFAGRRAVSTRAGVLPRDRVRVAGTGVANPPLLDVFPHRNAFVSSSRPARRDRLSEPGFRQVLRKPAVAVVHGVCGNRGGEPANLAEKARLAATRLSYSLLIKFRNGKQ